MSCFTVRGVCEGSLAGNWDLDVQWADSRVTSWSLCPGNSLLEWGHDRWFTFIRLNMAKGMECHIYNCLKKGGTICFTLSLTGFVKVSGCAGELGPQHGQTARSWDLSLTAREVEFFNNHAPLFKCSHCFWSLLIGLCHDKHCKDDFLSFPGGSVL